jgi:hypothetical protein
MLSLTNVQVLQVIFEVICRVVLLNLLGGLKLKPALTFTVPPLKVQVPQEPLFMVSVTPDEILMIQLLVQWELTAEVKLLFELIVTVVWASPGRGRLRKITSTGVTNRVDCIQVFLKGIKDFRFLLSNIDADRVSD